MTIHDDLLGAMTDDLIAAIGDSPHLTSLEGLFLGQSRMTDEQAQALAGFVAGATALQLLRFEA